MINDVKSLFERYCTSTRRDCGSLDGCGVAALSGMAIPQPKRTRWLKVVLAGLEQRR